MNEQTEKKKRLLSGVKPTGRPHVGNYLGAMRQFVELQSDHESFFMIADYHALTTLHDPLTLRTDTLGVAMDYLAIGLDPKKAVIFKQSDVPAHTEAAWIFSCITTMPFLMRAHAFKDAEVKNKEISVGTFEYPMLMAADIILYDTDVVPVGKDQEQHVEIARDTAQKFNRLFGETFIVPSAKILPETAVVPGTDGQKMSKSYKNTIPLFAEKDEIAAAVMSIVTDSSGVGDTKDPARDTVFALHRFFSPREKDEIEKRYRAGSIGHQESKKILIENIDAFVAPARERRREIEKDPSSVVRVLTEGAERAREVTEKKMQEVRERIGVRG